MKLRYVFVLLAVTLALAYFLQPRYTIKLERAFKVGESFVMTASGMRRQTTTVRVDDKDKETTDTKYSYEFEALVNIAAVDEQGQPRKQELTITKFMKTENNGTAAALVDPDTRVVYESGTDAPSITANDVTLSPSARAGLTALMAGKGRARLDRTFGITQKVTPGTEWPVNSVEVSRDLKKDGLAIEPSNLRGTVKLIGFKNVAGVDCMHVWSALTADNFAGPESGGSAEQNQTFDGYFPVDTARNVRFESYFMQLKWTTQAKRDSHTLATENVVTEETSVERKYAPGGEW